jgi:hypothetical protein
MVGSAEIDTRGVFLSESAVAPIKVQIPLPVAFATNDGTLLNNGDAPGSQLGCTSGCTDESKVADKVRKREDEQHRQQSRDMPERHWSRLRWER